MLENETMGHPHYVEFNCEKVALGTKVVTLLLKTECRSISRENQTGNLPDQSSIASTLNRKLECPLFCLLHSLLLCFIHTFTSLV